MKIDRKMPIDLNEATKNSSIKLVRPSRAELAHSTDAARERPWSEDVRFFRPAYRSCLVGVSGERAVLRAKSDSGELESAAC